jgi:hypothetical protein
MYDEQKAKQLHADQQAADLPMFRSSDPETSREAAARVAPHVSTLQARVLSAFRAHGPMTAKELEELPELADLGFSTARKRCSELAKKKEDGGPALLVSVGSRSGATIYELAERAQRQGEAAA